MVGFRVGIVGGSIAGWCVITATEPTPGGTPGRGPTRNGLVRIKGDQLSAGREPTCPSTGILACPLSLVASGQELVGRGRCRDAHRAVCALPSRCTGFSGTRPRGEGKPGLRGALM